MKNTVIILLLVLVSVSGGLFLNQGESEGVWVPVTEQPKIRGLIKSISSGPLDVHYPGASFIWHYLVDGAESQRVLIIGYQQEAQGKELINTQNRLLDPNVWKVFETTSSEQKRQCGEATFYLQNYQDNNGTKMMVYQRYLTPLGGTINPIIVKLSYLTSYIKASKGAMLFSYIAILNGGGDIHTCADLEAVFKSSQATLM